MRMKFTGEYTNGRTSITYLDCTFNGHDPREVGDEVASLLKGHPEFEVVRGRKPKRLKAGETNG